MFDSMEVNLLATVIQAEVVSEDAGITEGPR
jgi:hypothetical protein